MPVSFAIDFLISSKKDAPFHHTNFDYPCDAWDGLPGDEIFNLVAFAATTEFFSWFYIGIDVCTPLQKYRIKSHLSLWTRW